VLALTRYGVIFLWKSALADGRWGDPSHPLSRELPPRGAFLVKFWSSKNLLRKVLGGARAALLSTTAVVETPLSNSPPHPSAVSSAIITQNPTAKAITPAYERTCPDISGKSSTATTYIIAPAANANI